MILHEHELNYINQKDSTELVNILFLSPSALHASEVQLYDTIQDFDSSLIQDSVQLKLPQCSPPMLYLLSWPLPAPQMLP